MRLAFLALLTVLPLLEIAILVKFGQWAGVWITLAVVIGTAVVGVGILQRQGLTMLVRTQEAVMRGEPPVGAMVDGGMMVLAGALLIMLTDAMGLLLLVPELRKAVAYRLLAGVFGSATVVHAEVYEDDGGPQSRRYNGKDDVRRGDDESGPVIEGDFERLDERPVDPRNRPPGRKS
jgi:UPF0716 protein FxsA